MIVPLGYWPVESVLEPIYPTRRLCPMALCACPLDGKPDASDWPPPEPFGSGLFQQRYPGDFFLFTNSAVSAVLSE